MSLSVLSLVSTMTCYEILFRTRLPLIVRRLPHCGNPFLFHGTLYIHLSEPFLFAIAHPETTLLTLCVRGILPSRSLRLADAKRS